MNDIDWKKYFSVFVITIAVFVTGIYFSNYLSNQKLEQIRDMQDKVSLDILSSETRFLLLKESSCSDFRKSFLSDELGTLGNRVNYMESQVGTGDENVRQLKKYYSILQIKDYLLTKEVGTRCNSSPIFILYFYSNKDECPDCKKQEYVLDYLRKEFPELKIYSFDLNLELSAISTLLSVYKVKEEFPALVIKNKVYNGFQSIEDIQRIIPELMATGTATSTSKKIER